MLFWKYGTSDLAKEFEPEEADKERLATGKPSPAAPEELADDLEKMGPTFIKFGQLLSGRADLLPEPYLGSSGTRVGDFGWFLGFATKLN